MNLLMLYVFFVSIMKTCPCYEHPLTPHFNIVKLGFTRVYIFSYFCSKHGSWVHVRTSVRRFLRVPTIHVLSKNKKNITFLSDNYHFYGREILQYIARTCLRNGFLICLTSQSTIFQSCRSGDFFPGITSMFGEKICLAQVHNMAPQMRIVGRPTSKPTSG